MAMTTAGRGPGTEVADGERQDDERRQGQDPRPAGLQHDVPVERQQSQRAGRQHEPGQPIRRPPAHAAAPGNNRRTIMPATGDPKNDSASTIAARSGARCGSLGKSGPIKASQTGTRTIARPFFLLRRQISE